MIGRADLPREFVAWNEQWHAPFGRRASRLIPMRLRLMYPFARLFGPFGFQDGNNGTRRFEYPWAFFTAGVEPGMTAVDIGGGLGGLQFVLAKHGVQVFNVDPGERADMGWPLDHRSVARLNSAFGTNVSLQKCFLSEAAFADNSIDRVFSISTIEHIPAGPLTELMREVARILRAGGLCILTVDLFYDLYPFSSRHTNRSGRNVDVHELIQESGLELVAGDRRELCGFPEFDADHVLSHLQEFARGQETCVAQAFVLQKVRLEP